MKKEIKTMALVILSIATIVLYGCTKPDNPENGGNENEEEEYNDDENDDENTLHLVDGTYNGHDYVDLGLPSGALWGTCNIGANAPEDYGDYFAWGETDPKTTYTWVNYKHCKDSYGTLTKYCCNSVWGYEDYSDNLTVLEAIDDKARTAWGGEWRMPTKAECEELFANTVEDVWTTLNGVAGRLLTFANGSSIFLPAAGFYTKDEYESGESSGYYWSSSLYTENNGIAPYNAWLLQCDGGNCRMWDFGRLNGLTIRPICIK